MSPNASILSKFPISTGEVNFLSNILIESPRYTQETLTMIDVLTLIHHVIHQDAKLLRPLL